MLATLGYAPDVIEPDTMQRFPTSNKRSDDAGWCKLFADRRGGVFGCHRQGISETWTDEKPATMTRQQRIEFARQVAAATTEREAQQRQQWAENAQRIAALWAQCVPLVPGDPCTLYLKGRGFGGVWPLPAVLRFHRALPYWHEGHKVGECPAMVAPLIATNGRTVCLHRTFLTRDGRKADVPTVKKLTGAAGSLAGACIPLHKPARGCIGIAEGVETSLAAWLASGVPTVAAYCSGNLATWQWPPGIQRISVFADADKAGREAADTLRARALAANVRCEVLTPSTEGEDWCDVWAAGGAMPIKAGDAA